MLGNLVERRGISTDSNYIEAQNDQMHRADILSSILIPCPYPQSEVGSSPSPSVLVLHPSPVGSFFHYLANVCSTPFHDLITFTFMPLELRNLVAESLSSETVKYSIKQEIKLEKPIGTVR